MRNYFRRQLFWKFFFSYFALIILSLLVLGIVIRILLPGVFNNHLVSMNTLFSRHGFGDGGQMMVGRGRMMNGSVLFMDLFSIFNQIILESVVYAILPSMLIALGVSAVISRQFVRPLQQMTIAADRIAEGDYGLRLPIDKTLPESQDELERLAVRFNRMTSRLEQVEDMRQNLIGDVAHELRTPLTVIKGAMEGLIDGVMAPEDKTYEMIHHQVDRLERLVNDLQELNHIETGVLDLNLKAVNLQKFLEKIIHAMEINFSKKGIELLLITPESALEVLADEDRLEQVVINLLSNALQYTPEGGKVWVRVENVPNAVQITVQDTGVGIPEQHLPLLFSRFYRVDDARSRKVGGSGIGLTIAKKLVEAQGGTIWAESAGIGEGAVFKFTLPQA